MKLPTDTEPLLLIRLSPIWHHQIEEIEPGYIRSGHGWREGMSQLELQDSVRAWWKLDIARLERDGIEHLVAVVRGVTRAVYRIESVIGPRASDGRVAFDLTEEGSSDLYSTVVGPTGKTLELQRGAANPVRYWPPRS